MATYLCPQLVAVEKGLNVSVSRGFYHSSPFGKVPLAVLLGITVSLNDQVKLNTVLMSNTLISLLKPAICYVMVQILLWFKSLSNFL